MVTNDRLQTRAEADGYRRAWGEAVETDARVTRVACVSAETQS
jgi:hypothetical protein